MDGVSNLGCVRGVKRPGRPNVPTPFSYCLWLIWLPLLSIPPQSGFINSFPFDPAGMNSPSMATKEVKNGRLAMVGWQLTSGWQCGSGTGYG